MKYLPSKSAWLHVRLAFSFFLLPVFIFALSQSPVVNTAKTCIAFLVWHLFIYPASNGYNSYFDKDEGSIALLQKPPKVDKSLYLLSLTLDFFGILLAFLVSAEFAVSVFIYGLLSKMYSHPLTRLKKYPVISFLIVFFFQGAFVYWSSYAAISEKSIFQLWDSGFILAGLICSCLIGASYPLTQVYQHEEDSRRGDKTLSLMLGVRGSFWFSGGIFFMAIALSFKYWSSILELQNFWIFCLFLLPSMVIFLKWFYDVWHNETLADYKNMSRMTWVSGFMMLGYFVVVLLKK